MRNRLAAWAVLCAGALLVAPPARAADGLSVKKFGKTAADGIGLAVDAAGVVHVSWVSAHSVKGQNLFRLHYTRLEGGKKRDETIDANEQIGDTSLALDSVGRAHIAYRSLRNDPPRTVLKYVRFDGSAWQLEELGDGGFGAAIAIGAGDRPHIVHAFPVGQVTQTLQHLHLGDSGWESETPDGFWASGRPMSLVIDASGHAHVGLQSGNLNRPVYATNGSGAWVQVDLAESFSPVVSIALDSLGRPHAAFPLSDLGTVRYARFDGAEWQSEDLFDPNDLEGLRSTPWSASLVLDEQDHPQILFEDTLNDEADFERQVDAIFHAFHDGLGWFAIPVSPRAQHWTQLVADDAGGLHGAFGLYFWGTRPGQIVKLARLALADLTGEWTSLTLTEQGGESRVQGVLEIRNEGAGKSGGIPIRLFLSEDEALDAGDIQVQKKKVRGVAPGQPKSVKVSFKRPGALAGMHLIAVLDPEYETIDLDRLDNEVVGPLGD